MLSTKACDANIVIITARIQRMREGNIFSLCVSSHLQGGGYLHLPIGGTLSGPDRRGTPIFPDGGGGNSILPDWGIPIQTWEGVAFPSRPGMGVPPVQTWKGGTPSRLWQGVPPSRPGKGIPLPHPDLEGGTPLSRSGKGYSPPSPDLGRGSRSGPRMGVNPIWNSIVCTCYAAGGMSLAFTQEDFLVVNSVFPYHVLVRMKGYGAKFPESVAREEYRPYKNTKYCANGFNHTSKRTNIYLNSPSLGKYNFIPADYQICFRRTFRDSDKGRMNK